MGYKLKEKLSRTETDFWRRAARISRLVKLRNEVSRETMRVTQTILERMESNIFICYGHFVCMEDNRWCNRKMTWSPGRLLRGPPEIKWGKQAERVMRQTNLMSEEAANWQVRWMKSGGSPENECVEKEIDEGQVDTSLKAILNWVQVV